MRDELKQIIEATPISERKVSDVLGNAKINEKYNALEQNAWTAVVESLEDKQLDFIKGRKPKEYEDAELISDYAALRVMIKDCLVMSRQIEVENKISCKKEYEGLLQGTMDLPKYLILQ